MTADAVAHLLTPQPPPTGDGASVTDWLLEHISLDSRIRALLVARREQGRERYGTELRAHNRRSARADEVQEAIDGLVYAAQSVMEADVWQRPRAMRRLRAWVTLLGVVLEGL